MKSDEQLVKAAQAGSDAAFGELVFRYRDRLLKFLRTRSASHADAEDAIQDTFVSAYRYLDSYDPRWRFSTWLYRIAIRNLTQHVMQKGRGNGGVDIEGDSTNEAVAAAAGLDPLAQCIEQGQRENLWLTAKRLLTPEAFNAMWLHYIEDLPQKEVARVLDRSLAWTKVTLLRARRQMTKELAVPSTTVNRNERYG